MEIGDNVKVIERTYNGEVYVWNGVIISLEASYIETVHQRSEITHPQWKEYRRAYSPTYTKHYGTLNLIF